MFKRCNVVLLSTTQESPIFLWYLDGIENGLASLGLTLGRKMYPAYKPQHLYILSDDKIKEDDWFLRTHLLGAPIDGIPSKANKFTEEKQNHLGDCIMKIIATTDSSLLIKDNTGFGNWAMPSPSHGFLEKYVTEYNKGNTIHKVLVEYLEVFKCEDCGSIQFNDDECNNCHSAACRKDLLLKVDPKDNTITIKKIKDSWTRDEVRMAITYCVAEITSHPKTTAESMKEWQDKVDKWIETNL